MSLTTSTRKNPAAAWRHLDLSLAATAVITSIFGCVMVYSATHRKLAEAGLGATYDLKRQAAFVVLGIGLMVLVASIDYRIFRDYTVVIYPVMVFVLLVVLTPLGSRSRGQQGWFQISSFQLQPSEFAKLALIVCLAAYCANQRGELDWGALVRVIGFAAVPMALIYKQPDLGTTLVFVAILLGMLLVAGARPRHLAVLAALGVFGVVAVLQLGVLKHYQLDRLGAFLDNTNRSAYNLNQSKIAIGSGGVLGKGLFKGSQTNLSYVPEQNTDFIFTVVGEELGLVGSALLLALFAILVWRTWRTASLAKDLSGTLICVGILSMFVFQIFENVGMTMGIMPITGIPLPFMSYGGSSTLVSFAAVGLVMNVHMRRFS
ncbi:MAG: rod shape-determining protein RodA [Actinobacteria bacterium]|nr:rod shape-determining protein RodA [Actinomycetota bacterium]